MPVSFPKRRWAQTVSCLSLALALSACATAKKVPQISYDDLDFDTAAAVDLAGRDVQPAVLPAHIAASSAELARLGVELQGLVAQFRS